MPEGDAHSPRNLRTPRNKSVKLENFWTRSRQSRTEVVTPELGLAVPTVTRLALRVASRAPPRTGKVTFVTGELSRIVTVLSVEQVHAKFGDNCIVQERKRKSPKVEENS